MKRNNGCGLAVAVLALGLAAAGQAQQEAVPLEQAQRIAGRVIELIGEGLAKAPLKVSPSPENVALLRAPGGGGVLLLADKKLTAATVAKVGKESLPAGLLVWRNLSLVHGDDRIPADKLFSFTAGETVVYVVALGLRAGDDGLVLEVYGKEEKPLFTTRIEDPKQEGEMVTLTLGEVDEVAKQGEILVTLTRNARARLTVGLPD